jgi:NADPH-dependent 2,4-dienoyl-CoA reductase/sulfur reductase-like enzyme/rhodanese-related sulfurtransferase
MSKKVLIIGGVAGGASVAARLRRLDEFAEIIVFERGDYISFANCGLPYYIGNVIKDRQKLLVQTAERMKKRFNINIRLMNEVISISPMEKRITVKDLMTGKIYYESYDKLVLSPGAEPAKPDIPGIDSVNVFTLRNMTDVDRIKVVADDENIKNAVVIGGGFIGVEVAENLLFRNKKVTLVQRSHILKSLDEEMSAFIQQHMKSKGINIILGDTPEQIMQNNNKLKILLRSGREIDADIIVLGLGVKPEIDLAQNAGLKIGKCKGIMVNEYLQTSDPDIYAVGDAIEVKNYIDGKEALVPLAGPANRQGRIAANNIHGIAEKYDGTLGTCIVKVFDLTAASTGMNERTLKSNNINYKKCYTHSNCHAAYYPGSAPLSMKLLFDPDGGKIFGAQAVGTEGIDKRIDVLATAIKANLSVYDLQNLELSYAPPYGSARDPVNYLGYVAENIIKNYNPVFDWHDLGLINKADTVLLDVRTEKEYKKDHIEGAVNIPLDELRTRKNEIPKDKEIWIYCRAGLRGYIAARILSQMGYKVRNLNGGYKTYQITTMGNTNIDPFLL